MFGICRLVPAGLLAGQVVMPWVRRVPPIELLVSQKSQSEFINFLKVAPIILPEDMIFTDEQIQQIDQLALEVRNKNVSKNEAILALRGGDGWVDGGVIFVFTIFVNWLNGVQGFGILLPQPTNFPNPRWTPQPGLSGGSGVSSPTSTQLQKPSEMPQVEYSGLSKKEKKRLPHVNDVYVCKENRPVLRAGFNQIEAKTPKHGGDHGLTVQENGKAFKADALQLQQSLVDIAYDDNTEWYENGSFQSRDSVNLLDPERNLLSVYEKLPGENYFLTTLEMTDRELRHFKTTGGQFLSEKVLDFQQSLIIYNPN